MEGYVVGVDLGGTQLRAVLADGTGKILARHSTLTLAQEGPQAVLGRIRQQIAATAAGHPIAAIGIGAPGPTDPYQGVVLMGPNLPGWHRVPLRQELETAFGVPVFLGNDANLAGLAEHRYGAGRGCRHMVYMTVSTGIGTGVIVDNQMLLGRQGLAAELGHITIDIQAEEGDPPMVGTLEGLASGPNIARRAQHALRRGATSLALELANGRIEEVTPPVLQQAAQQGDAFALEQFRVAGRYLGIGITNILHIFNPERIVLGGSVWLHCAPFLESSLWETIRVRAQSSEYWQKLEIVSAALGDDVGLLGAVALAVDGLSRGEAR
ncbi:ROK family protein [Litorilinea aerophila]|uniref:ROK family protein n=1 Tax=Litorilinea aerophila TaxID=1204385 RepID=A0A540VLF4_9CHLR|nr:ROK family protein [Litorilinea aerophila]MCC9074810.1 ROK family protein [Litorilinea aerophila]GIV77867.1 MAG: glucokinase [Litorilinea sp.]